MNTTALAIIQPDELETIQRVGKMLAASGYFDGKGDGPQAVAMMATKIVAGREMGFGPFASVNGIHIIKGKPSVGANLMAAAVKGSPRYDYRVREMTAERCAIEFFERVGDKLESLGVSTFTKEDATAAETQNMAKFARNMLFARAMSNGVRWFVPDVFSGNAVYAPEELGADVDGDGNVIDTTYSVTTPQSTNAPAIASPGASGGVDVEFGMGNPFEDGKPAVLSEAQLKELHIVGREFYGDEWDEQRPKLVLAVSKGEVTSSKELTPDEATKLITGIRKKAAQLAAAQAQKEQVTA